MAVFILLLISAGLLLSFVLALLSIKYQYLGTLACWTACFSPVATAASIVLNSVVKKNQAENTGPNGEGLRFTQLINDTNEGGPTI